MMEVYRIYDSASKLYSLGGGYPQWSAKGKLWVSKSALKNHLSYYLKHHNGIPSTWYVIGFILDNNNPDSHVPASRF